MAARVAMDRKSDIYLLFSELSMISLSCNWDLVKMTCFDKIAKNQVSLHEVYGSARNWASKHVTNIISDLI